MQAEKALAERELALATESKPVTCTADDIRAMILDMGDRVLAAIKQGNVDIRAKLFTEINLQIRCFPATQEALVVSGVTE